MGGWGWRGERELDGGGGMWRDVCGGGRQNETDRQTERQTETESETEIYREKKDGERCIAVSSVQT